MQGNIVIVCTCINCVGTSLRSSSPDSQNDLEKKFWIEYQEYLEKNNMCVSNMCISDNPNYIVESIHKSIQ